MSVSVVLLNGAARGSAAAVVVDLMLELMLLVLARALVVNAKLVLAVFSWAHASTPLLMLQRRDPPRNGRKILKEGAIDDFIKAALLLATDSSSNSTTSTSDRSNGGE